MLVEWKNYKAFPGLTSYGNNEVILIILIQRAMKLSPSFSCESDSANTHAHAHTVKCAQDTARAWFTQPAGAPCSTWPHHGLHRSLMFLSGTPADVPNVGGPWKRRRGESKPISSIKSTSKQYSLCHNFITHLQIKHLFTTKLPTLALHVNPGMSEI